MKKEYQRGGEDHYYTESDKPKVLEDYQRLKEQIERFRQAASSATALNFDRSLASQTLDDLAASINKAVVAINSGLHRKLPKQGRHQILSDIKKLKEQINLPIELISID
jgi:hypothetical protein